jgi:hypothetical protein
MALLNELYASSSFIHAANSSDNLFWNAMHGTTMQVLTAILATAGVATRTA